MSLTIQQIEARLFAIRQARDSGALMVRHGDTTTQFRSLAEMDSIIADLEAQLAKARGRPRKRIGHIVQTSKGY